MNKLLLIVFTLLFVKVCNNKSEKENPNLNIMIPTLMKGYELYSWKTNRTWNFTLITGTNRIKTYEEISDEENITGDFTKITVTGINELKSLIDNVPAYQIILWNSIENCQFPPTELIEEIKTYSIQKNLDLIISQ